MRKMTTTEMIGETQAGSERLLTKLIREFISDAATTNSELVSPVFCYCVSNRLSHHKH